MKFSSLVTERQNMFVEWALKFTKVIHSFRIPRSSGFTSYLFRAFTGEKVSFARNLVECKICFHDMLMCRINHNPNMRADAAMRRVSVELSEVAD